MASWKRSQGQKVPGKMYIHKGKGPGQEPAWHVQGLEKRSERLEEGEGSSHEAAEVGRTWTRGPHGTQGGVWISCLEGTKEPQQSFEQGSNEMMGFWQWEEPFLCSGG